MVAVPQDPYSLTFGYTPASDIGQEFNIESLRGLESANIRVVLRIMKESHWVTVYQNGKVLFHEVLACVPLISDVWTERHRFGNGRSYLYNNGNYKFQAEFVNGSDAARFVGRLYAFSMEVRFPNPFGGSNPPFTRICCTINRQRVALKTVHTYVMEDERIITVLTSSEYRLGVR
jgi:hypothetical protein